MQTEASLRHTAGQIAHQQAKLYLASLDALIDEINQAMNAIACLSLPQLEDSVARQTAACARLVDHPGRPSQSQAEEPGQLLHLDGDLSERIRLSTVQLASLNRRYAALIKHSSHTVRLFAGLFRPYAGDSRQDRSMYLHLHTWSCDL